MCGICGIVDFADRGDLSDRLLPMLRALAHRGTVDGHWIGLRVGLATRRLPIIDVVGSPQPIFNEDKTLVLVGNGEIYNFTELTPKLLQKGHKFSTHGDLECILHLYEECGDEVWQRLNAMFAVAIYDLKRDELTVARDRIGVKPMFYAPTPSGLVFSSEIKSLRCHPGVGDKLNPQAISDYLSLQFVPRPQTVYAGVQSLAPGSFLKVKAGKMETKTYWRLKVVSDGMRLSRAEVASRTSALFDAAVKRQMVSDVPVGILLSGGLDSSAIAAVAARHTPRKISTFAIVFKEKTFDESEFSRQMAAHLQSNHHELVLDEETILSSLEDVARCFDEPFCEGSTMPVYHICRFAKQHVGVLLSGEGSDEIFGGYETYLARHMARYFRFAPASLFAVMRWMAHRLPISDNKVSLDLKLRRWTDGISHPPAKAHFWWRSALNDRDKVGILNPEFLRRLEQPHSSTIYERLAGTFPVADVINQLMATDCLIHLPDDLLYRADMMSMAHTLEVRVPFLDTELVDYAFSVPSRQKIRGLTNKIPLRDATQGLIPDRLRLRRKKGLNMPYQKWFKRKTWKGFIHDCLTKDQVEREGILDFRCVSALLEEHEKGLHNHAHGLWTILNLVLWLEKRNRG